MTKFIDVWAVHGNGGNEYSQGPVIAYCSTKEQADIEAKGKGWYGSDGSVVKMSALNISGEVWILANSSPIDLDSVKAKQDAKLKEETLASLSADQRRVLGLSV